ncbi:MAG: LytR C-terminal domain-containing protein [Frankiaceae bacterium]|nr:LytR C-terminal domain-containing protein [Frankiaceae bacterium]MBV9872777.1 LytR C-terminal domain-containing protein [Frankiaceae bacterium]
MTILGRGDLSPPRRNRSTGRSVTVGLVVILLGGGGFAAYKGLKSNTDSGPAAALPVCKKQAQPSPAGPPKVRSTKFVVDNATLTAGLANQVADQLQSRGLPVDSVGNTATRGKGIATVRYSADRRAVAQWVAAQIKGARLVATAGTNQVELDIGPKYRALQSKSAAKAAFARSQQAASPTPTATPSPTCRPRSVGSRRG